MKKIFKWLAIIVLVIGVGGGGYYALQNYLAQRNKVNWRTDAVVRGNVRSVVNSTGTVQPKLRVAIGSFVSGPILELNAEFNQEVKKGDLLARIDPLLYDANFSRDKASYESRIADVDRAKAQLQQAINDEKRAVALRQEDSSFIAQAEMDKYKFARLTMVAQLRSAETAVEQARAQMESSLANLNYTKITAPVDGIIINRKVDKGQTVAASFQTPELFVIAPDMKTEMHVQASVDEADIGQIKSAQQAGYPATFTVDAYPDELFEGQIHEVRLNSTTVQNVVTYPVIVAAPNPDMKLLPGMTASISFQVAYKSDVIKIPNAALRFYPEAKHVRKEDLGVLEGHKERTMSRSDDDAQQNVQSMSASERTENRKKRDHRHVWVQDADNKLRAVEVITGLNDSHYTQMIEGDLQEGDRLITGIELPAGTTAQ